MNLFDNKFRNLVLASFIIFSTIMTRSIILGLFLILVGLIIIFIDSKIAFLHGHITKLEKEAEYMTDTGRLKEIAAELITLRKSKWYCRGHGNRINENLFFIKGKLADEKS